MSSPQRLERLLIATCIAYVWIILMGIKCVDSRDMAKVHRKDRCDLSMFTLGIRYLKFLINNRKLRRFGTFPGEEKSVR